MEYERKSWRSGRTWREALRERGLNQNPSPYPTTRIFDNLVFIGDETVNCFLVDTSAGPVLIDLMWPGEKYRETLIKGIHDAGYRVEDVAAILITHGHIDHYGDVEYFRQKAGANVYMSEVDYHLALQFKPEHPAPVGVDNVSMTLSACEFVGDMDEITVGDTTIKAVLTPGHSPAGLSFIFPVFDEGRSHTAALWGGNGIPHNEKDIYVYLDALKHFSAVCEQYGVDVEVSNHPFVDNTMLRLELLRGLTDGVPNPFVIGREAYKRYEHLFVELCEQELRTKYGKVEV